ncbi:hypothetical protein [Jiangella endophytica]|nr:hypothetical protein [Jiangella endophytica]
MTEFDWYFLRLWLERKFEEWLQLPESQPPPGADLTYSDILD